jgi:hypothetical protein
MQSVPASAGTALAEPVTGSSPNRTGDVRGRLARVGCRRAWKQRHLRMSTSGSTAVPAPHTQGGGRMWEVVTWDTVRRSTLCRAFLPPAGFATACDVDDPEAMSLGSMAAGMEARYGSGIPAERARIRTRTG